MSPADGRHPPAPPPRCSCYQAEACCAAVSLGPHGAPRSRHIDQRQPRVTGARHGVRCKAIHIKGFGAGQFMSQCSEQDGSAVWSHLARSEAEPLPVMATGPCARQGPTRALNSGEDISLWPLGCHPCPAPPDRKKDGSRGGVVVVPE